MSDIHSIVICHMLVKTIIHLFTDKKQASPDHSLQIRFDIHFCACNHRAHQLIRISADGIGKPFGGRFQVNEGMQVGGVLQKHA